MIDIMIDRSHQMHFLGRKSRGAQRKAHWKKRERCPSPFLLRVASGAQSTSPTTRGASDGKNTRCTECINSAQKAHCQPKTILKRRLSKQKTHSVSYSAKDLENSSRHVSPVNSQYFRLSVASPAAQNSTVTRDS